MNTQRLLVIIASAVLLLPGVAAENVADKESENYWPQWRGPLGSGVAPHADPPVEWSESKNIRWKISLPGKGHSTPVIWGKRIFLTTAVPYGDELEPVRVTSKGAHDQVPVMHRYRFVVMAINRRDGKILWQKTVLEGLPHEGGHVTASLASASPITDGERLFAYFGSWGLYCLDLDGNVKWQTDFGAMHPLHAHGEGSSPALYKDTLVVNWDHEGPSFLVALDKRTGKERWKVERERASSWTTPIIVESNGRPQVIVSGSQRIRGYDLARGKVIWECGGLSIENVCATPAAGSGIVYAGSTYDKRGVLAIRFEGAEGDVTGTKRVVWTRSRAAPYVPSFLLYDGSLYYHYHFQGILSRVDALTGADQPGPFRLRGIRNVFASPIGAAGRVYISDLSGSTIVLRNAAKTEVLALNHLDDSFAASPVAAGKELYLRGAMHLYCIADK
jgi:outer membrane protein assembly factor BamB